MGNPNQKGSEGRRREKLAITEACLVLDLAQKRAATTLAQAANKAKRLPPKEAAALLKRADQKATAALRQETREALSVIMLPWSRLAWRDLDGR